MYIILFLIKVIHFIVWLFIKFSPNKLTIRLIKVINFKFFKINFKNQAKYKNFIKKISYKYLYNSDKSTCLSIAITARVLYNLIGLENNLKLGIVLNSNGYKVPHAWLEDKFTGEELTPKSISKLVSTFDMNL